MDTRGLQGSRSCLYGRLPTVVSGARYSFPRRSSFLFSCGFNGVSVCMSAQRSPFCCTSKIGTPPFSGHGSTAAALPSVPPLALEWIPGWPPPGSVLCRFGLGLCSGGGDAAAAVAAASAVPFVSRVVDGVALISACVTARQGFMHLDAALAVGQQQTAWQGQGSQVLQQFQNGPQASAQQSLTFHLPCGAGVLPFPVLSGLSAAGSFCPLGCFLCVTVPPTCSTSLQSRELMLIVPPVDSVEQRAALSAL